MTTGATGQLGLALPVQGELSGTWGDTVNNGITQYTNIAIAGTLTLTGDGAVTLANTTGDASASNITSTLTGAGTVTAQFAIVIVAGTLTTTKVVTGPSYSKTYVVDNTTVTFGVTFKASGQAGVTVAAGEKCTVYFNGTDYVKVASSTADGVTTFSAGTTGFTPSSATSGAVTLSGTLAVANGGTGVTSSTGTGSVVLSASPTLTGTPLSTTATLGTNTTQIATTAFVQSQIGAIAAGVSSFQTSLSGLTPSTSTTGAVTLAGTLGTANGGTGLTSFTSGGVVYASSTSALATGSALTFNGTTLELSGNTASTVQQIFGRGVTDSAFSVRYTNGGAGTSAFIGTLGLDYSNGAWADMAAIKFYRNSTAGELVFFASTSAASGTEQMRLTSTGLGIGTSTIGAGNKLNVTGDNVVFTPNTAGKDTFVFTTGAADKGIFRIKNDTTTTIELNTNGSSYLNGGDVGIGTSSPATKLHISGSTTPNLRFEQTNSSVVHQFQAASGNFFLNIDATNAVGGSTFLIQQAGSTVATLSASGNLGLGVTPSAWLSTTKVMQLGQGAVLFGRTASNQVQFGSNFYIDTSTATNYINTDFASKYVQDSGQHQFYTAASGTAGNAITFTQAMTLNSSGQLVVGASVPILTATYTGKLSVYTAGGANVVAGGGSNTTNTVMSRIVGVNQFNGNSGNEGANEFQGITSIETALVTSNSNVSGDSGGYLMFKTKADAGALTERLRIASTGAFGLSGANYGTSGQVLTSGGSAAAPTWTTVAAGLSAATQAEMEAASSNTVAVTPLSTNWHPGVAKVVLLTVGAGTPSIASSWNVTSITDQGVGELTVTIATDFSSTNYTVLATPGANSNTQAISVSVDNNNNPKTAGSFYIHGWNSSGSHAEPENGYNFACFGDQ